MFLGLKHGHMTYSNYPMVVQDVIMDHALQTISYIADIGDLLVIMVRLAVKPVASPSTSSVSNGAAVLSETERRRKRVTICCHIFESDEVSQCRCLVASR